MPNFFNRKQLAQAKTKEELSQIAYILQQNNIEYIAAPEENSDKIAIFVNKKDFEKANILIHN